MTALNEEERHVFTVWLRVLYTSVLHRSHMEFCFTTERVILEETENDIVIQPSLWNLSWVSFGSDDTETKFCAPSKSSNTDPDLIPGINPRITG